MKMQYEVSKRIGIPELIRNFLKAGDNTLVFVVLIYEKGRRTR